jgi:hypothetical protein
MRPTQKKALINSVVNSITKLKNANEKKEMFKSAIDSVKKLKSKMAAEAKAKNTLPNVSGKKKAPRKAKSVALGALEDETVKFLGKVKAKKAKKAEDETVKFLGKVKAKKAKKADETVKFLGKVKAKKAKKAEDEKVTFLPMPKKEDESVKFLPMPKKSKKEDETVKFLGVAKVKKNKTSVNVSVPEGSIKGRDAIASFLNGVKEKAKNVTKKYDNPYGLEKINRTLKKYEQIDIEQKNYKKLTDGMNQSLVKGEFNVSAYMKKHPEFFVNM